MVTEVMRKAFRDIEDGMSKADVARKYNTSPRSIGRWIARVEEELELDDEFDYFDATEEDDDYEVVLFDLDDDDEDEEAPLFGEPEDVEYRVLATRRSISITKIVDGSVSETVVIDNTVDHFEDVLDVVRGMTQEHLEKAFAMCRPKTMVESFTQGKLSVDVAKNSITYNPEGGVPFEIGNRLSTRIIETIRKDGVEGAQSLLNFLDKLMLNPSNRAVNELYGFLEHNDIKITPEGNFIAWKVVSSNYKDKHTGTFDNSVGTTVRVNRNQVDENSEQTCSYGLHVCAQSYIKHFGGSSDRVVSVVVDPADVVAIPADYDNAKMRCCGYVVLGDVTSSFTRDIGNHRYY